MQCIREVQLCMDNILKKSLKFYLFQFPKRNSATALNPPKCSRKNKKKWKKNKRLLFGLSVFGYPCAWFTQLLAISEMFFCSRNFRSNSATALTSMSKSYFCVLSDVGQDQKVRLSMVRMLLKTAYHMGEVFKQSTKSFAESPPLTSDHPKLPNTPSRGLKIRTLMSSNWSCVNSRMLLKWSNIGPFMSNHV